MYKQRLKEMTENDAEKEGGYTLEEFKEIWEKINKVWEPNLEVYVIGFQKNEKKNEEQKNLKIQVPNFFSREV